ncbi:hypothetical protein RISK_006017 [Rhodopirellula islandica]|uniref:Uncharacterized protein n=1 Tax=Rhodopirellula islandica TaxID=595434 RepID=A0A0J1B5E6_RHOIS|nr:hypothetical protein RISK_006017 [Rhodopirellula islandica]
MSKNREAMTGSSHGRQSVETLPNQTQSREATTGVIQRRPPHLTCPTPPSPSRQEGRAKRGEVER